MKQTTRDTLLIEMAKLLIGIAIYGAGKYDSDCTQLDDLREAIDDLREAIDDAEQEHSRDYFNE